MDDIVGLYLKEIGAINPLPPQQEFLLAIQVHSVPRVFSLEARVPHTMPDRMQARLFYKLLYKELEVSWDRLTTDAHRYGRSKPCLKMIIREAKTLQDYWERSSSYLYSYLKTGEWGFNDRWNLVARFGVDLFIYLHALPREMINGVDRYFTKKGTLPTVKTFLGYMPERCVLDEEVRVIENRAQEAQKILSVTNLKLVVYAAKRYTGRGLFLSDLIQEGYFGLNKAIQRFDPARGYKLSTYAMSWIRQAVTRAISEQSRLIRIPSYLEDQYNKFKRTSRQLEQKLGRKPNSWEMALTSGFLDPEDTRAIQDHLDTGSPLEDKILRRWKKAANDFENIVRAFEDPMSIDLSSFGPTQDIELQDTIPDKDAQSPEDAAETSSRNEMLYKMLQKLTPRERFVIQMRHGLIDGKRYTLEEIGKLLDLTRERVRQIQAKAYLKLRNSSDSANLSPYV